MMTVEAGQMGQVDTDGRLMGGTSVCFVYVNDSDDNTQNATFKWYGMLPPNLMFLLWPQACDRCSVRFSHDLRRQSSYDTLEKRRV